LRPIRANTQSDASGDATTKAAMIDLTPERRAALVALVERDDQMPKDVRDRLLVQLRDGKVPADMVQRIEARMGG